MSKASSENLLLVGKVLRPHGLEGLLRILAYVQSEESFLNTGIVFLKSGQQEVIEYHVLSVKPYKNVFLMKLDGLNSLEEAERFRGAEILISKDSLRCENDDEYFWFDLIGLKVYLNTGRYIGTLKEVLTTGSNDIYIVRQGEKEVLIPAIHEVVEEIDLNNKKMIISEMEGLLDLNEV